MLLQHADAHITSLANLLLGPALIQMMHNRAASNRVHRCGRRTPVCFLFHPRSFTVLNLSVVRATPFVHAGARKPDDVLVDSLATDTILLCREQRFPIMLVSRVVSLDLDVVGEDMNEIIGEGDVPFAAATVFERRSRLFPVTELKQVLSWREVTEIERDRPRNTTASFPQEIEDRVLACSVLVRAEIVEDFLRPLVGDCLVAGFVFDGNARNLDLVSKAGLNDIGSFTPADEYSDVLDVALERGWRDPVCFPIELPVFDDVPVHFPHIFDPFGFEVLNEVLRREAVGSIAGLFHSLFFDVQKQVPCLSRGEFSSLHC